MITTSFVALTACSGNGSGSTVPGVASTAPLSTSGDRSVSPQLRTLVDESLFPSAYRNAGAPQSSVHGWLSPAAKAGKHLIYSADYGANVITIYPSKGKSTQPIGQITASVFQPQRLFVDKKLNLYCSNGGNNSVSVYAPGATSPTFYLTTGVSSPTGITVSADGTVYVANTGTDTVTVYPSGQQTPSQTLSISPDDPQALALDNDGNLYVGYLGASSGSGILKFARGSSQGHDLGISLAGIGALAVDKSDNIILTDILGGVIDFFQAGQTTPSRQITPSGLPFELSMAKNQKTVYFSVANSTFSVQDVAYPSGTTLNTRLQVSTGAWPLAVSPDVTY